MANRRGKTPYTKEERELGYHAIVLADGNCAAAHRDLESAGIEIPRETLAYWKREFPEELENVRVNLAPELEEKRAQRLEALATSAAEVTEQLLERTRETAGELSAKDIPGAARNIATVLGITTEKAQLLRQRPTSITQHDYSSAVKRLERMGLVEGTAEEVSDAELVPET